MQIRITTSNAVLSATLLDNSASRDFAVLLPLTLTLRDFNGTEKISDLPAELSTADAPEGVDPDIGDITYYAPWGNLAIFYRDFGYAQGLVKLGSFDSGTEGLAGLEGPVTIEVASAGS